MNQRRTESRGWSAAWVAAACAGLVALVWGVYYRSLSGVFTLDDSHSIQSNPWVRSLANIPRFFADPSTFSTLGPNVDYRPVLQVTYALNYAISGYEPWSWKAANVLIHSAVVLGVLFLGRTLFGSGGVAPLPGVSPREGDLISACGAAIFAVHPVFSGAVNYVSARSSTLVAALVLPVLIVHLRRLAGRVGTVACVISLGLYAAALLTKIEAVALVGVLVLAEWLLAPETRAWPLQRRVVHPAWMWRLWPVLTVTAAGLFLWSRHSALIASTTRADADMTPAKYLATQVHAWWYYVGELLAPVNLMLENLEYPRSGSFFEPLPLLALAGWAVAGGLALACARRAPAVTLLAAAFVVLLAPTSSVVPLAEMVNEHRPYLPLAGITVLAAVGLFALSKAATGRGAPGLVACTIILGVAWATVTQQRHRVWRSELSLLADNAAKNPGAARVQMNYGLALRASDPDAALERLRTAVRLAPGYALARTNLGLALADRGLTEDARSELDAGATLWPDAEATRYWRGRQRAIWGDWTGALEDFRSAARAAPSSPGSLAALVEVLVRLGQADEAESLIAKAPEPARATLAADRAAFVAAVTWDGAVWNAKSPEAESLMREGLGLMRQAGYDRAREKFVAARRAAPRWVYPLINLGICEAGAGHDVEAGEHFSKAIVEAPDCADARFFAARWHAQRGRLREAAAGFREALRLGRERAETTAYLVATLEAMNDAEGVQAALADLSAPQRREVDASLDAARATLGRSPR